MFNIFRLIYFENRKKIIVLETDNVAQYKSLITAHPFLRVLTTRPGYFAKQLIEP